MAFESETLRKSNKLQCRECRAWEMASEIHEIFYAFSHNSTRLCLLKFGLSIFVVSYSSLSEVRQCYLCRLPSAVNVMLQLSIHSVKSKIFSTLKLTLSFSRSIKVHKRALVPYSLCHRCKKSARESSNLSIERLSMTFTANGKRQK